jgi:hypothetical protein
MKYICLGYIEPGKFEGMTDAERQATFDDCFEYNDHLRQWTSCRRSFVASLRCAWACGSKELFFLFFQTVRLKSYPVTCEWPRKRVVAAAVYCCFFLSLRFAAPGAFGREEFDFLSGMSKLTP